MTTTHKSRKEAAIKAKAMRLAKLATTRLGFSGAEAQSLKEAYILWLIGGRVLIQFLCWKLWRKVRGFLMSRGVWFVLGLSIHAHSENVLLNNHFASFSIQLITILVYKALTIPNQIKPPETKNSPEAGNLNLKEHQRQPRVVLEGSRSGLSRSNPSVRIMRSKWGGVCACCGEEFVEGAIMGWDPGTRETYCKACSDFQLIKTKCRRV